MYSQNKGNVDVDETYAPNTLFKKNSNGLLLKNETLRDQA